MIEVTAPDQSPIRQMPEVLANKIAAGEVVQHPASVVKELLENAIDAGAGAIEIVVRKAGLERIQVVDDGRGIAESDIRLCFARHATSKIASIDDLDSISTLGFRGEALASIGAVARVRLRSKRPGNDAGVEIVHGGGKTSQVGPCAMSVGTSVSVSNLFFNVPARRRFLKSDSAELRRVVDAVQQIALSHPDIAFRLEHDGRDLLNVDPDVSDTDTAAIGKRTARVFSVPVDQLVRVSESTSYLRVTGVVGRQQLSRKSRGRQVFVVNGRVVRNRYLEHAVRSAYGHAAADDEYPLFVLFLDLSPGHVDVNVHPSKAEVKFDDERGVYSFVRAIIARAMATADEAPWLYDGDDAVQRPASLSWDRTSAPRATAWQHVDRRDEGSLSELLLAGSRTDQDGETLDRDVDHSDIWQLAGRYLVVQLRSGLLVVDQRAAHERVIYERTLAELSVGGGFSQQLLFPLTIDLAADQFELATELLPELRKAGFDIDAFGGNTVVVRGIPAETSASSVDKLLPEILDRYEDDRTSLKLPARELLARSIAICAAVRSGMKLEQREMRNLVDQLLVCREPERGPDGRPTFVRISASELDRQFLS